jgi:hypothetical protein
MRSDAGEGNNTLFWEDIWLDGMRIQELAPSLYERVLNMIRSTRMVSSALVEAAWAREFGLNLNKKFLELWP